MSEVQETGTKKQYRFRIISMIIVVVVMGLMVGASFIPFFSSSGVNSNESQRVHILGTPRAVSPTISTMLYMPNGTQNHTMINITADGYATQAFPAQTTVTNVFLSYVNFTITVSVEKYYEFRLWTGDLGAETNQSRVMMKLGDKVVGNKIFNSTGSGDPNSFVGPPDIVVIGEVRILPGTYDLKLINMINETSASYQESENYVAIEITPQSRLVYPTEFSFAYVADLHYTDTDLGHVGIDGNWYMGSEYSFEINRAWVDQINAIATTQEIEFIIVNGDLESTGPWVSCADKLRWLLDNLTIPYYLTLGNHDVHPNDHRLSLYNNFSDIFPEWTPTKFYYYRDIQNTRFVFLDTDGGDTWGIIDGPQQNWLNATLNTNLPVFIAQHFPLLDGSFMKLFNAADILAILNAHSNIIIADFAGHGHNEWIQKVNGIIYSENPCIIQWPFFFTIVDWYRGSGLYTGDALDINRWQLNYTNSSRNEHMSCLVTNTSLGIGDTEYVQLLSNLIGPEVWNQTSGNLASTDANWLDGTKPVADAKVIFNATSTASCTWDLPITLDTFSMNTGYSGTVTVTVDMGTTEDIILNAGMLTGNTVATITCAGNIISTTTTYSDMQLNVIMTGVGKTMSGTPEWLPRLLTINEDTNIAGVIGVRGLTVAMGKTVMIETGSVFTWRYVRNPFINDGIIAATGTGVFRISGHNVDANWNPGIINAPVEIYAFASCTGNRVIMLTADAVIGGAITVFSDAAISTMTLDLSASNYNLSATHITIGTRGILNGRSSAITCSVNWNSTGTFIQGAGVLYMTGGRSGNIMAHWLANGKESITFTVSGLESGTTYKVYVDDVIMATIVASGGQISFAYSAWSEHTFEVVVPTTYEPPDDVSPPSSDKSPATSDPGTTSFSWTSPALIAVVSCSVLVALVLLLRRPKGRSGTRHS